MPRDEFDSYKKHLRVVSPEGLPARGEPGYDPLQNIKAGLEHLKAKPEEHWIPGRNLSIDETQITCGSIMDPHRVYHDKKPKKYAKEQFTLADRGKYCHGFVLDSIDYRGSWTYEHPEDGKINDIVRQLTQKYHGSFRNVTMDNRFSSHDTLRKGLESWNIGFICTFVKTKFKGLPNYFKTKEFAKKIQDLGSGSFIQIEDDGIVVTVWNDRGKIVFFTSNCVSTKYKAKISRRSGSERLTVECPLESILYNGFMGLNDSLNSRIKNQELDQKTQRKQNRVLYHDFDMYARKNAVILYIESEHLWKDKYSNYQSIKTSDLLNELAYNWGAPCAALISGNTVRNRGSFSQLCMLFQPLGIHEQIPFEQGDAKSQLRCSLNGCNGRTRFKCNKCKSLLGKDCVPLCSEKYTGRTCFKDYHKIINRKVR